MQNNTDPQINFNHPQLRIVKSDALNRPTNARLLQAAGATATDSRGSDLTAHLNANLENIDFSVAGRHQIPVAVMDDRGNVGRAAFTLTIVDTEADLDGHSPIVIESAPESAAASQVANSSAQPAKHHHRHLLLGAVIGLIVLVLVIWGVSAHQHAANQAAESSSSSLAASSSTAAASSAAASSKAAESSATASSKQDALASQNSGLSGQVNSLKGQVKEMTTVVKDTQQAVTDYKESNDRAQYESSIASLQQQVASLQQQVQQGNSNSVVRGAMSSQLDKLSTTVGNLENSTSPSDASSTLKDSGVNGIVNKLQSLMSGL